MKQISTLLAFNRGLVSPRALARLDLKRLELSAETMTNWIAGLLGSMSIRPGSTFIHSTRNNAAAKYLPFVFSTDDTALVELTNAAARIVIGDVLLTRSAVSTTITNGNFDTDISGWADSDEVGASSVWASGGFMYLLGDGTNEARRDQAVTIAGADLNDEHGLAINVRRGILTLRLGTTAGGTEYGEFTLRPGVHSIAVTPTVSPLHIRLASVSTTGCIINSINVESAGVVTLTAPWLTADLDLVRADQSGDVIFVACENHQPRRIERHAARSWSIAEYQSNGPFRDQNTTAVTITPANLSGPTTLTASRGIFTSQHVGAVFRLESAGQNVLESISADNTFSDPIRVTGVLSGRLFAIAVTGTFVATVTLQRSMGAPGDWVDVENYTVPTSKTLTDGLDNQIAYYRIGVKTGDYTSGTITAELAYDAGTSRGRARVTGFTSSTVVDADIEDDFGSVEATADWWESAWSDYRGWPSALRFHDGRLWFGSSTRIDGSVSDDFENFDDEVEGDSGPIRRTISTGPVDRINWIASLEQLLFGTEGSELVAKSSSFDEPLTPSAFSLKPASTYGSTNVDIQQVDTSGFYVGRSGSRLFEIAPLDTAYRYGSGDLTILNPDLFESRIVRMAVQRFPDTRVHCVRADGKVGILIFDRAEKANCWQLYETEGAVEDVVVLPGETEIEDRVYYVVNRTINGATKRYLEKWAKASECVGAATNKLADCGIAYSGASASTITGLSHLEGETVCAWGNGKDLGTYTVSSGSITLSEAVTLAWIGLPYTADWRSARMAIASASGNPLTQKKILDHVGLILQNTHAQGLKYGDSFSYLDSMPLQEEETDVAAGAIHAIYDEVSFELNGSWTTDARLCLRAQAPRPATVLAVVITGAGHDKQ